MTALFSLSDLNPEFDGEPRLLDLTIADRLGYERPRKIRELIESNLDELKTHGPLAPWHRAQLRANGATHDVVEYWLNEAQCLLVCMFSRTSAAAEVRRALIEVFMAWRRGALPPHDAAETDALPAEDMRSWLKMVSESRMLFGKIAARRLWLSSPLPKVDGMETHAIPIPETAVDLDPLGCWRHLLDWMPRGTERTIAELLADRANPDTVRFLRQRGILPDPKGWDGWIAISNTNRDLARLFAATPWRANWALALLQLAEARRYPGCIHFDTTTRAVLIPLSLIGQVQGGVHA